MIDIECIPVGELQTNCYLLTDGTSGRMAVVDPGEYTPALEAALKRRNPDYILLTHGHYDHIGGVMEIYGRSGAQIVVGKKEMPLLSDGRANMSLYFSKTPIEKLSVNIALSDGDSIMLGETKITFVETPGHTAGSGCYIFDDCIISGDTLFFESIGRTDFETGSIINMISSLWKLRGLKGDFRVFPGHGPSTTLQHERLANPYMKENGYEDIY